MKSLCISVVFFFLNLVASGVNAAPCVSKNCAVNQKLSSGVRQYAAIGTKNWARLVLDKPKKNWFRTEWDKVMGRVVNDPQTCAFDDHYPSLAAKFRWSDAYIDGRIKPTQSQARDPNWSNYVWNRSENGDGFVYDGITDALNDPLIDNGKGIAKLAVIVSLTSTAHILSPPEWMRKDKALTWMEGKNQNGSIGHWHVRFDKSQAVDHAADFLTAFLAKYGNNKGIHSLVLGEYFLGQDKYRPQDLNRNKYQAGVKNLWEQIVSSAPRDKDGKRINIVQTNPVFNTQVSMSDMEKLGLGVSESDTHLDLPTSKTKETMALKQLYAGGKVHVMIHGDARYACQSRRQSWDGTPNPFGHRKGYAGVATPQELFWYHGEKGPVPTHSFFMAMAPRCAGAPQTAANFIDAIKRFGRCGAQASKWGAAPAAFSNVAEIDAATPSKPRPPTVVVN